MKEIKTDKEENKQVVPQPSTKEISIDKIEEKEPNMKDKIDKLYSIFENEDKKNNKRKLRVPRRAKVRRNRMKKGSCGILFLNENRTVQGEKVKLEGGTYKTKDKGYHVTNGKELIFWEGKFPLLWQRYDKLNPTNLFATEKETNQIYGQDLVMLRMKKDAINEKKKGKFSMIWIVLIVVAGYFLVRAFFPDLLG